MKVLMFGWEFPPHITGGLGTACYGLTKGLSQTDTEVLFVVPKAYGDEDESYLKLKDAGDVVLNKKITDYYKIWENLTYIEIASNLVPYLSPEEFEIANSETVLKDELMKETTVSEKFEFSGKYGKDLMKEVSRYAVVSSVLAKQNEFDVIHAHDWLTYPAGIAAKQISGKPLVVHMHATEFDRSGENVNKQVFDIEKQGMENADKVIAVSHLTRKTVIEKYGIAPEKVVTVHNAVEPVESQVHLNMKKGVPEKIVTFLGRITFQKGPEYFIEAAYKVLQKYDNVRFVMAGSGDMLNKMIKRVAALGIATKFHFTGFLKGDEVPQMFSLSDVYIMPSVSEPFGISPLEAMRSNVPVIISKQSGVSEILNHAVKIDFWDIDAMADAIYGLLNYNGLSGMFRQYGKEEVDNLKWENAAVKVNSVYESVVN
ncbi:MAG: glycosyltransferase family 4 protein [Bacteroidetes bacterium]|jgi:glycogen synthase|nr:glycosyltransferase family 4 protein [Bacteroidota bacterium]MBT6686249.1 glycosyltransferase family 4 protein [Bacteroidota bacterium]MBT7144511.1 glycosyltransferase family 4 protein [Bacteroidota bacterium]MBT7491649.1 glycosyltransferase family 4 protein [Bacteroidota bacterium]